MWVYGLQQQRNLPPSSKISGHLSNHVDETKNFGMIMQSNLKFSKLNHAKKTLECSKYALNNAPRPTSPSQTLTYVGQYLNMQLPYADVASIQEIQNRTIRFVKNIRWWHGIIEGQITLRQKELAQRKKATQTHIVDQNRLKLNRGKTCSTLLSLLQWYCELSESCINDSTVLILDEILYQFISIQMVTQ